ncbi:methyl-accepting chemotaxis protein [Fontibacillus phaseoli]|uniref:Methyl-accepting chemotaxis protein n=1 Tax=Fontibacillus phaseoli TaxID=1416533 RepID=A0A369BFN3_9BACL|nr:methyl-accepting chemotaxis protein [Fontibacillus phaseoli]RCX20359.1 methyl-accepting chemotaxis protein [Fontibacillus phaseoli]
MSKRKHSINRKFMLTFAVVIVLSSVLFSSSFFIVSMGIINKNVLPQFDKVLQTSSKDIFKNLDTTQALQLLTGKENSRFVVESYLSDKVEEYQLHTAYLLDLQEDKATVIGVNKGSKMKVGDQLEVLPPMEDAESKGKASISELYSDQFGSHKTAYMALPGSSALLAVGMDATFIEQKRSEITWICFGIFAFVIAVGMVVAFINSRRITNPLKRLAAVTEKMAQGDFREQIEITSKDEIGQLADSFRTMTAQLKEMIGKVLETSNSVVSGSDRLLHSSETFKGLTERSGAATLEIEKGSFTIASTSAENARAMEEISQGVQHIATSSAEVTEKIGQASEESNSGNELAKTAVEQMRQVEQAAIKSREYISVLNDRSESIAAVVSVIMDITKQINILALNAAIEAARAGEHGKGFAVVAEEVRKLAEQSRTATDQISEYLLSIREEAMNSVNAMELVSQEIKSGTDRVNQAGIAFGQLTDLIYNINLTIQSVSASTEEVSAGTEEVTASVEEAANITAKSLQNIEEIAKYSGRQIDEMEVHSKTVEALYEQARSLQEAVEKFKI